MPKVAKISNALGRIAKLLCKFLIGHAVHAKILAKAVIILSVMNGNQVVIGDLRHHTAILNPLRSSVYKARRNLRDPKI